jgi:GNAT superfamily N-acetyltransferase
MNTHEESGPPYTIRQATPADAATLAHQRAAMFRDMGWVTDGEAAQIEEAARPRLAEMIAAGEYFGWVVEISSEDGGQVVAGGGIILRRLLPRPGSLEGGEEAYILNVYTEPEHRRRGVARRLMRALLAWCDERGAARVTLHASDGGRPLYEELGFAPTNEMRLTSGH